MKNKQTSGAKEEDSDTEGKVLLWLFVIAMITGLAVAVALIFFSQYLLSI